MKPDGLRNACSNFQVTMCNSKFIFLFLAISLLGGCHIGGPKSASKPISYYVVSEVSIEGGRFVETPDFPKLGYIRPVPDLVIGSLKTAGIFKLHTISDSEGLDEHTESWGRAIAITLFLSDAKKAAELERQNIGKHNLVWMFGDKPLGVTYLRDSADSADSVPVPTKPQMQIIPFREDQKIGETEHDLKSLVRP